MCRCERGRGNEISEEKRAVGEGIRSFRAERKARKRRAGDRNVQDRRSHRAGRNEKGPGMKE